MGKETVKSRIPDKPNKEISFKENAVRIGLVPLAIATLALSGCSQEPTAPQAPAGVSGNSAQFPGTNNDRPLQTPRETPKPALQTQKKEGWSILQIFEKKTFKKPDELFKALLTAPIQQDELPSGMTARGNSAGNLDATMQALKAIGQINISIEDGVTTPLRGTPNGAIGYNILPDASSAKAAFDIIVSQGTNKQSFDGFFDHPATMVTIPTMFQSVPLLVIQVDNVTIVTTLISSKEGKSVEQPRMFDLTKAAIQHLLAVGR